MRKSGIDMTEGKPLGLLVRFTIPALISNFLSQIYSLTDSIIVGRYLGKTSLAAIGVCMPVILLTLSIVIGINVGCGVLFSQSFGKKNYDRMRKLLVNSAYFSLVVSALLAIAGYFLTEPILRALSTPEVEMADASAYLKVNFLTTLLPLAYYLFYNVFRGLGDSFSSLLCLIVSVASNVFLDLLFVIVFKMGVIGSAVATAIAQLLAVIFSLIILFARYKDLRIKKEDLPIDFSMIVSVVRLAIPFALQFAVNNLSNIFVQRCINDFGDSTVASYTIASRIGAFALIPVENIGASLAVYVGQNIGAKKKERIEPGVKASHLMNIVISIVVAALVAILGKWMTTLFLSEPDEEVVQISYVCLLITSVPCILSGIMNIYQNVLKGMGRASDTVISGLIQLVSKVGIALIGTFLVRNLTLVWVGWPISFIAGALYSFVIYSLLKKRWKKEEKTFVENENR